MNEINKYNLTNSVCEPTNDCWYKLPCGICTRTNEMCPIGISNIPATTWTSTSTGEVKKNGAD